MQAYRFTNKPRTMSWVVSLESVYGGQMIRETARCSRDGKPSFGTHLRRCGQGTASVGVHAEEPYDPIAL
jgi:hypothetical protein